nr:uncharacterized protein LOC111422872 [Onthophagus taurus]
MVMDGYCSPDRLPELWNQINSLHLSYLEMDESPKKLEHRQRLEDCIKEFLCIAPHRQKFWFKEAAEVLHRSANSKKDFSGYKAAMGWNAIAMYAGNLIAQPWRQEYREIKTYSGFYKHQIESNLVGAEIMFEAMGYKHAGNGIMVLEGPICPDRVTNVSQDSLVAYVECQILKEIWEEVCASSYKITWLEVLEFRETHLCSPRKSVDALKYQIQQRQYHDHHQHRPYSQEANEYSPSNCRYSHVSHVVSPTLPSNHSFPPLAGHTHILPAVLPAPPPSCVYTNGYNYGVLPGHYTYPAGTYNNFYCNGYLPQQQQQQYGNVPTGQLIELGTNQIVHQSVPQNYDIPDGAVQKRVKEEKIPLRNKSGEEGTQFENWDYVYRNLESQGYSKDLGERGDVLSSPYIRNEVKYDLKHLDQKKSDLKISDRPLKINEALEKLNLYDKRQENQENPKLSDTGLSSSYENISSHELKSKTPSKNLISKIKMHVNEKERDESKKNEIVIKWECKFCTFLNENSLNICEMCGKSKVLMRHEMEIGGSECSQCTLVNPKEKSICEACGFSLQNSPTYI